MAHVPELCSCYYSYFQEFFDLAPCERRIGQRAAMTESRMADRIQSSLERHGGHLTQPRGTTVKTNATDPAVALIIGSFLITDYAGPPQHGMTSLSPL